MPATYFKVIVKVVPSTAGQKPYYRSKVIQTEKPPKDLTYDELRRHFGGTWSSIRRQDSFNGARDQLGGQVKKVGKQNVHAEIVALTIDQLNQLVEEGIKE